VKVEEKMEISDFVPESFFDLPFSLFVFVLGGQHRRWW
jgi:hypothetical protein